MNLKTKTRRGPVEYLVSTVENPFRPGGFESAVKNLTTGSWVEDGRISFTEDEARQDHDSLVLEYGGKL